MMKGKRWLIVGVVFIVVALAIAVWFLLRLRRGGYLPKPVNLTDAPAPTAIPLTSISPSATSITTAIPEATPTTGVTATPTAVPPTEQVATPPAPVTRVLPPPEPINLPPGFGISIFADGLVSPRMMAIGPDGELYVAERGAGRIVRLPDRDQDGIGDGVEAVAVDLNAPSSIAFYQDGSLYVGETTQVLRLRAPDAAGVFQQRDVIVSGLPRGGHNTRTLLFSPDEEDLFVSVGSSCNVCEESDSRRATIMRYTPEGENPTRYAWGLRNAVGITFRPGTDELWATNNGRDWLGDDLPPETIYRVQEGDDAGWPTCHSGRIVDPDFGSPDACEGILSPVVEMQAHSAPLGLGFYTGDQFPEMYHGDLFVAFHGSWNRSQPTGYKVVRIPIDEAGTPGPVQDFAAGWLRGDGSQWGRPVDVLSGSDGSLFVSDDGAGRIYRIFFSGE